MTAPHSPADPNNSISAMFGRIARWYDPLNRLLSLGIDQRWRQCLAQSAMAANCSENGQNTLNARSIQHSPGSSPNRLLDLAAGTLDVSLALARLQPSSQVLAMDFCLPMLKQGRRKLCRVAGFGNAPPYGRYNVLPTAADARCLPLPNASVDALTMAFGIRNIVPRQEAFAEMFRVLRPGGRACILEFGSGRRPIWKGLYNWYLNRLLPLIGKWGSGDTNAYAYLAQSIVSFPVPEEVSAELRNAGFARVYHLPLTSGIVCLHVAEKKDEYRENAD